MNRIIKTFLVLCMFVPFKAYADASCHGQFPNLINDICWDCTMPITLFGGGVISSGNSEDYDTGSIPALCACQISGRPPKPGFHSSFWEFARQADITRTPYCMVSLGMQLDFSINGDSRGAVMTVNESESSSTWFRHTHWYINPAMGLMEVILDNKCLEPKGFDISYLSEIDPTAIDEEMANILNPEAFLFGNVVAQLACAADCVAATISFPTDLMYWCSGCNGTVFPMTNFLPSSYGGIQASSLATHKTAAKLHRTLVDWTFAGPDGMCGGVPQVNMDKRQYKNSLIYPIPQSSSAANSTGRCCQPFGRTTEIWGAGREIPTSGEDFAYAIFRKRDCCN